MKRPRNKTEIIGARIEPDLKKRFEDAARRDSRSVSGALVVAVKDYIEKVTRK